MARPRLQLDEKQIEQLAMINCSLAEIGAVMKCSVDTLERYAEIIKRGRENGKSSLKKKQFEIAMKGNVTMLIWLGKIMLGQRDNSWDVKLFSQEVATLSNDELVKLAKEKMDQLAAGGKKNDQRTSVS